MNLSEAFGTYFVHDQQVNAVGRNLGSSTEQTDTQETVQSTQSSTQSFTQQSTTTQSTTQRPEVYLLHVEIGRDDCHLLCMFLLVFTISFLLSSRK